MFGGDYEQKQQMKYKEATKCEVGVCKKLWLGKIQNHIETVMS